MDILYWPWDEPMMDSTRYPPGSIVEQIRVVLVVAELEWAF